MRFETFLLPALRALMKRPKLTEMVLGRDSWGNPYSDEVSANPDGLMRRVWEDGPVTYKKNYRRWFVSGYEECQLLANHPDASTSAQVDGLLNEVRPYSKLAPVTKTFFQNWMLLRDGADHTRLRKLASRTFTPRRISEFEPQVELAVRDLLRSLAGTSSVEIVEGFNRPLPVNVITRLLGIPAERNDWTGDIVARTATFLDPLNEFSVDVVDDAVAEFSEYIRELTRERLRDPQPDLITALAQVEDDGDRLSHDELLANVGLLVFAGHDTTTNMLGNAMLALAANPDQRTLVRENPELWPNAVEELLRFDTTVVALARELRSDIDVGSHVIPAGATVSLQLNAANRDPRRWDDPYQLRLDRADPRPLSFGHGLHHCLGHALARMELRVALRAFVEDFGDYTVDTDATQWRTSVVLRGPAALHITRG